jgi:hypothetical protein
MLTGIAVGAGAVLLLSLIAAAIIERDAFVEVLGWLASVVVLPVFALCWVLRKTTIGGHPLAPETLARFCRAKQRGGGHAFTFFYGRRGVIFVHGLRDNKPVPTPKVRVGR